MHPCLFSTEHSFATVHEEYNAVWIDTDAAGDLYFHGKGAGGMPAASAVVSDLADLCRWILSRAPAPAFGSNTGPAPIKAMAAARLSFYIRLWARDRPGVLAKIAGILAGHGLSIAQIFQGSVKGFEARRGEAPVILLTHPGSEGAMQKALSALRRQGTSRVASFLRVEPSMAPGRTS